MCPIKLGRSVKFTLIALATIAAGCLDSPERNVEKGGFTFDFKALSDARFTAPYGQGINLAEGVEVWKNDYCRIASSRVPADDPRRKEVRKAVEWKKEGRGLAIVNKPELAAICGDAALSSRVVGGFTRCVKFPDDKGGRYRISFRYKLRHDNAGDLGGMLLTPRLSTESADSAKSPREYPLPDLWRDDGIWSMELLVPPRCDRVDIVMALYGIGELRFSDFAMVKMNYETPVTARFAPCGILDGKFAFSAGQCGLVCVQARRNGEAESRLSLIEYELSLPRGYTLVEAIMAVKNQPIAVSKGADGSTVYRMRSNGYDAGFSKAFNHWAPLSMLVKADEDAGAGTATFVVLQGGKPISNVAKIDVFTIPAIKVALPKRYCNGFYTGGQYCDFKTTAAREGFADLFTDAGATWVANMRTDEEVYTMWRRKGVRYITPERGHRCADGFRIGDGKGRPDDQKYVTPATTYTQMDKWTDWYKCAICPVAVYEEKSYFKDKVVPDLANFVKGADGMWANWEPYMFAGRGCFCDSCCRAFAEWMKVPYEEMKKEWPNNVKWGGKYWKESQKFRSWQHGRLVKTINRHVIEATGGDKSVGLIPAISWREMSSVWRPKNLAAEVQAIDYAGDLRWINPWGPYPRWNTGVPYMECKWDMLFYWCAAKDVREQVNRDYVPEKRPKLMAFPHGFLGDSVSQPESVSLGLDSFFFNGWEAAIVYTFPKGFDARWWRAFAEATARAAKYEDAVFDGARVDGKVSLFPDAGYPDPETGMCTATGMCTEDFEWPATVSYLQCAAYDYGGQRICAVFNFAHDAVAHFTLKAQGLPSGRYEVVSEDGATWPRSRFSRTFSAEELAEGGVRLAVGALRVNVFELRPTR